MRFLIDEVAPLIATAGSSVDIEPVQLTLIAAALLLYARDKAGNSFHTQATSNMANCAGRVLVIRRITMSISRLSKRGLAASLA